jgi:hypothetical protein
VENFKPLEKKEIIEFTKVSPKKYVGYVDDGYGYVYLLRGKDE